MTRRHLSPASTCSAIFENREVVQWHRVSFYQQVSLKLISQALIFECPAYSKGSECPPVYIPGEPSEADIKFNEKVVLYASPSNPGAARFAADLAEKHPSIEVVDRTPSYLVTPDDFLKALGFSGRTGANSNGGPRSLASITKEFTSARRISMMLSSRDESAPVTHMLLYLSREVFSGTAGSRLAGELRRAQERKLPIFLVHECDSAVGGEGTDDFGYFFQVTPEDLVIAGLYSTIAVAMHAGSKHRAASFILAARTLAGATTTAERCSLYSVVVDSSSRLSGLSVLKRPSKHVMLTKTSSVDEAAVAAAVRKFDKTLNSSKSLSAATNEAVRSSSYAV